MALNHRNNYFFALGTGLILCLVSLIAFSPSSGKRSTLGYIDTNALWQAMANTPEVAERDSLLAIEQQGLQAYFQELQNEFNQLTVELSDTTKVWNAVVREEKITRWQMLQTNLQEYGSRAEQSMSQKLQELNQPILEKMNTAVVEVAEANGYIYVFDSSFGNLVYAKNEADYILPDVLAAMGLN